MKRNNNNYPLAIQVIFIIIVSLMLNALILNHLDIQFDYEIPIIDILGFLVTICLALYIAHIVEAGREKKQSINEIIISIITSHIKECDDIQRAIYANNLTYAQASSFQKKTYLLCMNIKAIIERANCDCIEVLNTLSSVSNCRAIGKLLTDIKYEVDYPKDYLEVSEGMICKISPARRGKILMNLEKVKQNLYKIWVEMSLMNSH